MISPLLAQLASRYRRIGTRIPSAIRVESLEEQPQVFWEWLGLK
jgi:hypothetical protein